MSDFFIPANYILKSFEVVTLFTNFLSHGIELIKFKKYFKIHLVFNDKCFKQTFGAPMGSTISPIIVNYVWDESVRDCLKTYIFDSVFEKICGWPNPSTNFW